MKMKKRLSLLTAAAIAMSAFAGLAFAATEDDLATISSNATFIAQNETTESFLKDSIHWNNQLLTLNGDNQYNTKKGNSLFNDTAVQNLLQVKQGRNMVLSVGGACTIDVYHDDNSGRIIQAGSANKATDYTVVQTVLANGTKNYDVDTITVPTAGLVYIGASGDVFVSVIDVKFGGGVVEPTKYTVTLVDGETSTPTEVEENGTFTFPTPDERVGASFSGWVNADDEEDIKMGGDTLTVTGNATYNAVWTPVIAPTKYTITLVDGDTTTPNVVEENGTFTFPTPNEPIGMEFVGWMNSADTTDIKMGGDTLTVTGDATYTAVWNEVVEPTVNVEKIGVFTEGTGNPAAAFKGSVTAGTYAISTLRWVAYTDETNVTDVDLAVNIASGSTVVTGLVVEAANVDVNAIDAGVGPVDSLDVILDR